MKLNLKKLRSIGDKYENDVMSVKDYTLLAMEMLSNWTAMLDALEGARTEMDIYKSLLESFYKRAETDEVRMATREAIHRVDIWLSQFEEEK